MENASKALIIAGAILIAILLIGVGVFLINSANDTVTQGGDVMSNQALQAFNSQFTNYSGQQKGNNVKSLLQTVITSNAKDSAGRKVAVTCSGASVTNKSTAADISKVVNYISNNKTYTVSLTYGDTGVVTLITIA